MTSLGRLFVALVGALLFLEIPTTHGVSTPDFYALGKEYIYEYQGYILSGVPDKSSHYSGYKLKATAVITFVGQLPRGISHMQLQLRDATLNLIDGEVSPVRPEMGDSPSKLTNQDLSSKIEVDLSEPLHFNWKNGQIVGTIRKSTKDKGWVIDLKKGVLSMFIGDFRTAPYKIEKSGITMTSWKLENDVDGLCKTGYSYRPKGKMVVLTRIRDLLRCSKMHQIKRSFMRGRSCVDNQNLDLTPLRGERTTTFELYRKDRTKFFIKSTRTRGQYVMPIPKTRQIFMGTYIVQELTFKQTGGKATVPKIRLRPEKLSVTLSMAFMNRKMKKNTALRGKIGDLLKKLKTEPYGVQLNVMVRDLVDLLRQASPGDISWTLNQAKAKGKRVDSIVQGIIGSVGTNELAVVVLQKIRDKKTKDSRAANLLRMLSLGSYDPVRLMRDLQKIASSARLRAKDRTETLQTLWMMVGALYSRLLKKKQVANGGALAKWFRQQSKTVLPYMDSDMKRATLLMAYGNAGSSLLRKDIAKYLSFGRSLNIRLHAVNALRKLARKRTQQSIVRSMLWPIFANSDEDTELRISAFIVLIDTQPARRHMSILMSQMRQEPSGQIKSFVLSYLQLLGSAACSSPCLSVIAMRSRWALPLMPGSRKKPGMFESRLIYYPMSKALGTYIALIYTGDSPVPRSIQMGGMMTGDEATYDLWNIYIRSEESRDILRSLASPGGSLYDRLSNFFKTLKKENNKVKKGGALTTMRFGITGEDVGLFGTTFQGSNNNVLEMFQNMLRRGMIGGRVSVYWDNMLYLPTAFGAPLSWNATFTDSEEMNSKFKAKKDLEMNVQFRTSFLIEQRLGVLVGGTAASLVFRSSYNLFPGKAPSLLVSLKKKGKNKFQLSSHIKPMQVSSFRIMKIAMEYFQVRRLKGNYRWQNLTMSVPMTMTSEKKMTSFMGTISTKTFGINKPFNMRKITDGTGENSFFMSAYTKGNSLPFIVTMDRQSRFCGFQLDFILERPPSKAKTPKTSKVEKVEVKLIETRDISNEVKESKKKPYKYPMDFKALANAKGRVSLTLFRMMGKSMMPLKIGSAGLKFDDYGSSFKIEMKAPGISWKKTVLKFEMKKLGPPLYYDPANPFTIVSNAGTTNKMTIYKYNMLKKQTLMKMTLDSRISKNWIEEWKRLLKTPERIATTWPEVYRCYQDTQGQYPDSPNCYRGWRQLQTFDNVSSSVWTTPGLGKSAKLQYSLALMISSFFSFYQKTVRYGKGGEKIQNMYAILSPTDKKAVGNNMKYFKRVTDDFPRWSVCNVKYYEKPRQLYIRTFDGLTYLGSLPKESVKKSSFIIARDTVRGDFTVAVSSGTDGKPLVQIITKINAKDCTVQINKKNDKPNVVMTGPACSDNVKKGWTDGFFSVKLNALGLEVTLGNPMELEVKILGTIYYGSLVGLCGNMDRESPYRELRACTRRELRSTQWYYDNDRIGWDMMMKDYMVKDPKKLKC